MVSKSVYDYRLANDLCVRCGEERGESDTKQCITCIEAAKGKRNARRVELASAGKCVLCGDAEQEILSYCKACHDKKTETDRKIYNVRVGKKLCVKCKAPAEKTYCSDCNKAKFAEVLSQPEKVKNLALQCYGNKCVCGEAQNLLVVTSDAKDIAHLHGNDLYLWLIKYRTEYKKNSDRYAVLCNECYRQRCIASAFPTEQVIGKVEEDAGILLVGNPDEDVVIEAEFTKAEDSEDS